MTEKKDLEQITESYKPGEVIDEAKKSDNPGWLKSYMVDTLAGTLFFQPLLAVNEYLIAGMDIDKVIKARIIGTGIGFVMNRPYGKFREYWAKLWNADADSSRLKKFTVDASGLAVMMTPFYAGSLYYAGASLEEMLVAVPTAIASSAALGRPYGWWMDQFRKYFRTNPTLDK